jgi:DNA end-binding protein Ku
MARSLWSGSLSFGLVNVPVALYSAVRDRQVHFRQIHEKDGSPIVMRRVCAAEDREVDWEEIVRGYEVSSGKWVLLNDEELAAAAPRKTKTIDIDRFVELDEVDPIYFDHPYWLVPTGGEGAARAYALLLEVMRRSERAALGRFVLRTKEYLVLIRDRDGALSLTTLLFDDEVRPDAEVAKTLAKGRASRKEVDNAIALIEELGERFDPSAYRDEHRAHLRAIIKRKQKGQKIEAPAEAEEPQEAPPDLMAALERSLAAVRGSADGG